MQDPYGIGIDWLGPMPVSSDEDTEGVHVQELPNYLTQAQTQTLLQNLTLSDIPTEESMVYNFALARHYVYHTIQ